MQYDIFTDALAPAGDDPDQSHAAWLASRRPGDMQLRPEEPWPGWLLR